jgi:hypothetical protein
MRKLLSAGLIAATLFATAPFATAAIAGEKKPVDPNKKICRRDYGSTGTILPKSVCHTGAEWKALDEANRANVDQMQDRMRGSSLGRN